MSASTDNLMAQALDALQIDLRSWEFNDVLERNKQLINTYNRLYEEARTTKIKDRKQGLEWAKEHLERNLLRSAFDSLDIDEREWEVLPDFRRQEKLQDQYEIFRYDRRQKHRREELREARSFLEQWLNKQGMAPPPPGTGAQDGMRQSHGR